MSLVMRIKRLLRPLVPDRLLAWLRLGAHSRQFRVNVDVVVDGFLRQQRWLLVTPDTYRVRSPASFAGPTPDALIVGGAGLDQREREALLAPLTDPQLAASVYGTVRAAELVDGRRSEPRVQPTAVAVRPDVIDEIGGDSASVGTLVARVRDAGHHIALIPGARGTDTPEPPIVADLSVVVLALVPLHDIGGGSRGAQLAQEFLALGAHVTYVCQFGTAESVDLGLRYVHPALEQHAARDFEVEAFVDRVRGRQCLTVVEAPTREHLRCAGALSDAGYTVVYDLIDDWEAPSLGGHWYDRATEQALLDLADVVTASAPDLVRRVQERGVATTLVPNAVNARLFAGETGPRPDDLPKVDGPVLGYHGSLYGDWFDWRAVERIARAYPEGLLVLIGDVPGQHPPLPVNVKFLGLKAQYELPGYVSRFDVGLIPFVVSDVTHAVSPLKVYEYLASGVPVAAPPLRSLEGLPAVHVDEDIVAAVGRALQAPPPDPSQIVREHGWTRRVAQMLELAGFEPPPAHDDRLTVLRRPVTHYSRRERRLT